MQAPDMQSLEDALVSLAVESVATFAAKHETERFYAFGFDCNAEYGDVLLCANTEADFANTAARYVEEWKYDAEQLADLKKNFGDWEYQGFNLDQSNWRSRWEHHQEQIEQYLFSDQLTDDQRMAFCEELMRCFCRALVRVEHSDALQMLAKEPGFYTQVVDHDEGIDEAAARLQSVRAVATRGERR